MLKMTIAVNANCLSQKNFDFQYLKIKKRIYLNKRNWEAANVSDDTFILNLFYIIFIKLDC